MSTGRVKNPTFTATAAVPSVGRRRNLIFSPTSGTASGSGSESGVGEPARKKSKRVAVADSEDDDEAVAAGAGVRAEDEEDDEGEGMRGLQSSPISPSVARSKSSIRGTAKGKGKGKSRVRVGTLFSSDGEGDMNMDIDLEDEDLPALNTAALPKMKSGKAERGKGARRRSGSGSGDDGGSGSDVPGRGDEEFVLAGRAGSEDADEDEEWGGKRGGKGRAGQKVKALSKKDRLLMEKQQAEIRANKDITLSAYHHAAPRSSMGDFLKGFQSAWQQRNKPHQRLSEHRPAPATAIPASVSLPALTFDDTIDKSSQALPTPEIDDEIGRFSSSGAGTGKKRGAMGMGQGPVGIVGGSSPTRGKGRLQFRRTSPGQVKMQLDREVQDLEGDDEAEGEEEEEEEDLPSLMEMMQQQKEAKKREVLRRKKLDAIAAEKVNGYKKAMESDSDDDIEIVDMPVKQAKKVQEHDTPRGVISKERPVISDAQRRVQAFAGRKIAVNNTITDSYLKVAGQAFDHANLKRNAGGALPQGVKAKKANAVSAVQMQLDLMERQRKQNAMLRAQKEKEFGVKAKELGPRQSLELERIIAEANVTRSWEVQEEDSDPEDGEYKPDGDNAPAIAEEDDAMSLEESGEKEIVYSGEEDEGQADDVVMESAMAPAEPMEIDEEGDSLIARSRRKRQAVQDSDDEDVTPQAKKQAPPVKAVVIEENFPGFQGTEFDADADPFGFGEGGFGDAGFSQFFGKTQMGEENEAANDQGFQALRGQEFDVLLATQVDLPDPTISATAARQNEALLEGEMMLETEQAESLKAAPKRYINAQGLLTQTRPLHRLSSGADTSIVLPSETPVAHRSSASEGFSATYRTPASDGKNSIPGSGPEDTPLPRRLKPRKAPEELISSETEAPPMATADSNVLDLPAQNDVPLQQQTTVVDETSAGPIRPVPVTSVAKSAFDVLKFAAAKRPELDQAAREKYRGRFVEGEAEESDDEDQNWAGRRKDDDDPEDGDQNADLEELIDRKERSEEDMARDRELLAERHKQIVAEDDAQQLVYHQKAIDGKFRGRRADGILGDLGLSDESDDEDTRKKRKIKKHHLRNIENDSLQQMAHDDPFRRAYESGTRSDEDDSGEDENLPESIEETRDERSASPVIRDEFISTDAVQREVKRLAQEKREECQVAQRNNKPVVVLDSDSSGSDTDTESFQVTRNESQIMAGKFTRRSDVFDRYAKAEQRPADSLKAGGNKSVSANPRKGAPARQQHSLKKSVPVKTASRALSGVMNKGSGFVDLE